MDKDKLKEYLTNNKTISSLLAKNENIQLLQKVDDCLLENAVPLYNQCHGYMK